MPSKHEIRFDRAARRCVAPALLVAAVLLAPPSAEATVARSPSGGGGTVVLEPVPASGSSRVWRRLVFTCRLPDLVVFSDRPCGPLPIVHELKGHAPPAATGTAGASSTVVPQAPSASTRPASFEVVRTDDAEEATQREVTCRRLLDAVRALDERMRAGYSARQAALLWSRWREAKERLREADC